MSVAYRTTHVMKIIAFDTCILLPSELMRVTSILVSMVPLMLFATGEYIGTGKEKYTSVWANMLEYGGKQQIQDFANRNGIGGKIYSKISP